MNPIDLAQFLGLLIRGFVPVPKDVAIHCSERGGKVELIIAAGARNNVALANNKNTKVMKLITDLVQLKAAAGGIRDVHVGLGALVDETTLVPNKPEELVPVVLLPAKPKTVKPVRPIKVPKEDFFEPGPKGVGLTGDENLFDWERAVLKVGDLASLTDPYCVVMRAAAYAWNTSVTEILSDVRPQKIVDARQMAMYIATKWQLGTLTEIAEQFKRLDHGTVIHARRTVTKKVEDVTSKHRARLLTCLNFLARHVAEAKESKQ